MPIFNHHRYVRKDAVAVDATVSDSWTADADYIIKRLHLQNATGDALINSTLYFKIGEKVFTRPEVPAVIFGPDRRLTPEVNIIITKGEKLDWTIKNKEAGATDFLVTLEIWKP